MPSCRDQHATSTLPAINLIQVSVPSARKAQAAWASEMGGFVPPTDPNMEASVYSVPRAYIPAEPVDQRGAGWPTWFRAVARPTTAIQRMRSISSKCRCRARARHRLRGHQRWEASSHLRILIWKRASIPYPGHTYLQSLWISVGRGGRLGSARWRVPRRRFSEEADEQRVADDGELVTVVVAADEFWAWNVSSC